MRYTTTLLTILLVSAICFQVAHDQAECAQSLISDKLIGKTVLMNRIVGQSTILYLHTNPPTICSLSDSRMYLYQDSQIVHITNAKFVDTSYSQFEISFINRLIGPQTLVLQTLDSTTLSEELLAQMLETVFDIEGKSASPACFARNRQTGLVHSALCNHLDPQEGFEMLSDTAKGTPNRLCPICFGISIPIPDYEKEAYLGNQSVSYCRSRFRELTDTKLTDFFDSIGTEVLNGWPMARRGYRYAFILIDDPTPNATACPGGTIFVNYGLLSSFDSRGELEGVLAHEIAHVELRHSLREFLSAQKSAKWSSIVSAFVGGFAEGAAGASTDKRSVGVDAYLITQSIIDLMATEIQTGFSIEHEAEADLLANLYMERKYGSAGSEQYVRVLKKLQYFRNEQPIESRVEQTHPALLQRIATITGGGQHLFSSPICFCGYDSDSNLVMTIRMFAQAEDRTDETFMRYSTYVSRLLYGQLLFADVSTTRYLRDATKIKGIKFKGLDLSFDDRADTEIVPGQKAGLVLYGGAWSKRFQVNLDTLEITSKVGTVEYWKKACRSN